MRNQLTILRTAGSPNAQPALPAVALRPARGFAKRKQHTVRDRKRPSVSMLTPLLAREAHSGACVAGIFRMGGLRNQNCVVFTRPNASPLLYIHRVETWGGRDEASDRRRAMLLCRLPRPESSRRDSDKLFLALKPLRMSGSEPSLVGTWLSLVEHSLGVRGVGSSNLPVPTNLKISVLRGIPSRGKF